MRGADLPVTSGEDEGEPAKWSALWRAGNSSAAELIPAFQQGNSVDLLHRHFSVTLVLVQVSSSHVRVTEARECFRLTYLGIPPAWRLVDELRVVSAALRDFVSFGMLSSRGGLPKCLFERFFPHESRGNLSPPTYR